MRPTICILLLLSIGLTSAAPLARNHQKEARQFYGKLVNLLKTGQTAQAINLVARTVNELVPGLVRPDQVVQLRAMVLDANERKTKRAEFFPLELENQAMAYIMKRSLSLTIEANRFLGEEFDRLPQEPPKLERFFPDFAYFRMRFDALSGSAKESIIKAFPIFGRMDEIAAYIEVFDEIVDGLLGMCQNLPGFDECDKLMALT